VLNRFSDDGCNLSLGVAKLWFDVALQTLNPICNLPYFGAVLAIVLKNSSLIGLPFTVLVQNK